MLIEFLGVPVHSNSKTQSVIAQCSVEGELSAIGGSGVAEGRHIRLFLMED